MQLYDLNSKPSGGKSLRYFIDRAIGVLFYPPPGYDQHKLLRLDRFHEPIHRQLQSYDKPD